MTTTYESYSAPTVAPYPIVIEHALGCYLYDSEEKPYLDMVSGVAVVNFGHQHPQIINALIQQLGKVAIVPRIFHNEPLSHLLHSACKLCELDQAIPMNTGAEAVETAIKVVRKWAYASKGVPNNLAEILVCQNSFHGRTISAISASSTKQYTHQFGPLTPGFQSIPYNDPQALQEAITPNTAAFFVEPIQGEAGVILPDPEYLKECAKICKDNNVLLIIDEIQTGIGRTGKDLAYQHAKIKPDGVLLGKALGGGLLPISLFVARKAVMQVLKPGDHGSTFGGNPLACAVANEALSLLKETQLSHQALQKGKYFIKKLKQIQSNAIVNVRGRGLMIGIELDPTIIAPSDAFNQLKTRGLLTLITKGKVIRLLPPLTISQSELDEALNIINTVLSPL